MLHGACDIKVEDWGLFALAHAIPKSGQSESPLAHAEIFYCSIIKALPGRENGM